MTAPSIITQPNPSTATKHRMNFVEAIERLIHNFDGRLLVSTRFTPEDQVLTHLIFKNNLPVRVFTTVSESNFAVLQQTVEHYGKPIEVLTRQAISAIAAFADSFNDQYSAFDADPSTAPLPQLLAGKHVIVSGLRRGQFADPAKASPFIWDETQRKFRYYPLFYWTAAEVDAYINQEQIPHPAGSVQPVTVSGTSAPSKKWNTIFNRIFHRSTAFRQYLIADIKALLPVSGAYHFATHSGH